MNGSVQKARSIRWLSTMSRTNYWGLLWPLLRRGLFTTLSPINSIGIALMLNLCPHKTKKSQKYLEFNIEYVRAVLIARSTHRGSGIAHRSWTSKLAEASRRICVKTPTADAHAPADGGIYISTRHLPFATFLTVIEIFQVSDSQERAPSKRFLKCLCRAKRSAITADPPALPMTGLPQCGLRPQI